MLSTVDYCTYYYNVQSHTQTCSYSCFPTDIHSRHNTYTHTLVSKTHMPLDVECWEENSQRQELSYLITPKNGENSGEEWKEEKGVKKEQSAEYVFLSWAWPVRQSRRDGTTCLDNCLHPWTCAFTEDAHMNHRSTCTHMRCQAKGHDGMFWCGLLG